MPIETVMIDYVTHRIFELFDAGLVLDQALSCLQWTKVPEAELRAIAFGPRPPPRSRACPNCKGLHPPPCPRSSLPV